MTRPLNLNRATVAGADGQIAAGGYVVVRAGVAKVQDRRGVLVAEKDSVTDIAVSGRNEWTVTFSDGSTWTVTRPGGCGCGKTR